LNQQLSKFLFFIFYEDGEEVQAVLQPRLSHAAMKLHSNTLGLKWEAAAEARDLPLEAAHVPWVSENAHMVTICPNMASSNSCLLPNPQ
jgi:hypothetical protein